ncbi:MAG: LLM class flavin-dependent oxidoreductase [Halobacteriales archaeon]|nr:LLM class flavin-dependent oxidoreductase [Halobacteriales archaeon]
MSGLDLGYSVSSAFGRDEDPRAAAEAVLDRAALAADAGYDLVEAGDHHLAGGYSYLQNVPMAARLAERFDRVAAMFLLPLYDPIHVAEDAGTLAALVDEFDLWCAVGYNEAAFEAFGVPLAERAGRMEESLALLDALWADDGVTFEGEFYRVHDASVNPKAEPRVCIGGTARPAVERAARLGDAWVANADLPRAGIEQRVRTVEEHGHGVDVVVRRDALVLEDGEAAEAAAEALLADGYRGWGPEADWLLTGDAEAAGEELAALRALGVDEVVVRPMAAEHADETLRGVARARDAL